MLKFYRGLHEKLFELCPLIYRYLFYAIVLSFKIEIYF